MHAHACVVFILIAVFCCRAWKCRTFVLSLLTVGPKQSIWVKLWPNLPGGYLFLPPFAKLKSLDKSKLSTFFAFISESVRPRTVQKYMRALQLPFIYDLRLLHLWALWHKGRVQLASLSDATCLRKKWCLELFVWNSTQWCWYKLTWQCLQ